MFGIQKKSELVSEIEALEAFRPSNNAPSSTLPKDMTFERLMAIAEKFSNWPAFLDSFLMGSIRYNGWEAERYGNITKLLTANGSKWPNP